MRSRLTRATASISLISTGVGADAGNSSHSRPASAWVNCS